MIKLNPYSAAHIRAEVRKQEAAKRAKLAKKAVGSVKKATTGTTKKKVGSDRTQRMNFVKSLLS